MRKIESIDIFLYNYCFLFWGIGNVKMKITKQPNLVNQEILRFFWAKPFIMCNTFLSFGFHMKQTSLKLQVLVKIYIFSSLLRHIFYQGSYLLEIKIFIAKIVFQSPKINGFKNK